MLQPSARTLCLCVGRAWRSAQRGHETHLSNVGAPMVCEILVALQGRVDAAHSSGRNRHRRGRQGPSESSALADDPETRRAVSVAGAALPARLGKPWYSGSAEVQLRCGRPKTVVMLESESMSAAKLSQKRTVGRTSRVSLVKHGAESTTCLRQEEPKKRQRFEPQALCEAADRLRL